MSKKLYVGNLPWSVTSSELEDELRGMGLAFEKVEVVFDRETERSRGFAFVHFALDEDAEVARGELDGREIGGRTLVANLATSERRERSSGGRFPRGSRRGGRGGRGGRPRDDWGG